MDIQYSLNPFSPRLTSPQSYPSRVNSGSPRRQKKLAPALGFRLVQFVSTLTQSEKDLHPFRFSCVMENELSLLRRDHNAQQADRRLSRKL